MDEDSNKFSIILAGTSKIQIFRDFFDKAECDDIICIKIGYPGNCNLYEACLHSSADF